MTGEGARLVRELHDAGTSTGTTACLVLAGGRFYRVSTMVCAEYPDIRQSVVFRTDANGWPESWGRFIVLNGMDRDEAIRELADRIDAKRRELHGATAA